MRVECPFEQASTLSDMPWDAWADESLFSLWLYLPSRDCNYTSHVNDVSNHSTLRSHTAMPQSLHRELWPYNRGQLSQTCNSRWWALSHRNIRCVYFDLLVADGKHEVRKTDLIWPFTNALHRYCWSGSVFVTRLRLVWCAASELTRFTLVLTWRTYTEEYTALRDQWIR